MVCSTTALLLSLRLLLSWRCAFRLGLWHLTRILRFILDVQRCTWKEVWLSVFEPMANIQVCEVCSLADSHCTWPSEATYCCHCIRLRGFACLVQRLVPTLPHCPLKIRISR